MTHVKLRFVAFLVAAVALLPLGARAFCHGPPLPPPYPIYEYVNEVTGHYVLLADPAEVATLNARSGQARWHKTGNVFGGSPGDFCDVVPSAPKAYVCNYYAPSIDAYFQSARESECAGLSGHAESG